MKKTPWDIIILNKYTKNHDHMLCCSWNMAHDRCNCYFSFWAIFCPFTPITARRYYHFTQVYQKSRSYDILFLRYGKWHMQLLVFMLGYFSPVYPAPSSPSLLTAQKIKIKKKNEKNTWTLHYFTQVYQRSWSYAILFLRYGTWWMQLLLFILAYFFALLLL